MKNKFLNTESFAALMADVTPYHQDKRYFRAQIKDKTKLEKNITQLQAETYFSDLYQPLLPSEGPMRWQQEHVNAHELKRLRRGDYIPDLLLDLHGMRQAEAKLEIAALINACVKGSIECCCIMHGHGTGILKQMVPMWLAQHPKVSAFHQATKEWGANAALLVLINLGEQSNKR